jgi:DNA mismatch repair protein MLH3
MSIKPIPGDVIAQIRSSAVITCLKDAVNGLVKNSLDAGADKINIAVDYGKGNCSVEDDGHGIRPSDFQDGGGLGQLHCESVQGGHQQSA